MSLLDDARMLLRRAHGITEAAILRPEMAESAARLQRDIDTWLAEYDHETATVETERIERSPTTDDLRTPEAHDLSPDTSALEKPNEGV